MDTPVTRAEFYQYQKTCNAEHERLSDEDERQNKRLDQLEDSVKELASLAASVEKLATNMEGMLKEQEKQGKKLETLEARDGEMWRKVVGYVITAVVGIALGFIFTQIGM